LKGDFPSELSSKHEADAIDWVLRRQVWCCTEASSFPTLLVASREVSLIGILECLREDSSSLDNLSDFDIFICLIIAITSAIPFLNLTAPQRKEKFGRVKLNSLETFLVTFENHMLNRMKLDQLQETTRPSSDAGPEKTPVLPEFSSDMEDEATPIRFHGFSKLKERMEEQEEKEAWEKDIQFDWSETDEDRRNRPFLEGEKQWQGALSDTKEVSKMPFTIQKRKQMEVGISDENESNVDTTPTIRRS
jgi:hypothetical protein